MDASAEANERRAMPPAWVDQMTAPASFVKLSLWIAPTTEESEAQECG